MITTDKLKNIIVELGGRISQYDHSFPVTMLFFESKNLNDLSHQRFVVEFSLLPTSDESLLRKNISEIIDYYKDKNVLFVVGKRLTLSDHIRIGWFEIPSFLEKELSPDRVKEILNNPPDNLHPAGWEALNDYLGYLK
jgi:hypothetical protein